MDIGKEMGVIMNRKLKYLAVIFFTFIFIVGMNKQGESREADSLLCSDCNVIIVSLTNLKTSHLGFNGYSRDTTPNIDQFFQKSITFQNAFSTASWTRPAAASLFTSLYPYTHNVNIKDSRIMPLNPKVPTLAEILKKQGYITASFNGGADYSQLYGFDKGFDVYQSSTSMYGKFELTIPPAVQWLKQHKDQKFFLFLQAFDLHCPFTPPVPYNSKYDSDYVNSDLDFNTCFNAFQDKSHDSPQGQKKYIVYPIEVFGSPKNSAYSDKRTIEITDRDIQHLAALYDGELNYVDSLFENFFNSIEQLGLYDNTIIAVMSEHGEILGKKGRLMKGGPIRGTFYDDVMHIPLSIYHPYVSPGQRNSGMVSIVDILPTMLDFLGIKYNDFIFQGKSLIPLLKNNEEVNEYVFGGTAHFGFYSKYKGLFPEVSSIEYLRSKKWKLIREQTFESVSRRKLKNETIELYQIDQDAEELNDVSEKSADKKKELLKNLNSWVKRTNRPYEKIISVPFPIKLKEEMKKHGYW